MQRVRAAGDGHNGLVLMAHRFAVENEGRLVHVPGIGWHAWDGRRWAAETGEVYRAVHVSLRTALHDAADLEEDARKRLWGLRPRWTRARTRCSSTRRPAPS